MHPPRGAISFGDRTLSAPKGHLPAFDSGPSVDLDRPVGVARSWGFLKARGPRPAHGLGRTRASSVRPESERWSAQPPGLASGLRSGYLSRVVRHPSDPLHRDAAGSSEDLGAAERSVRRPWGLLALALAIAAGVTLERTGVLDWRSGLGLAQSYTGQWWLAPGLTLVTAALFTGGLPGSLMVWIAGVLFPPAVAVSVLVAGGLAGALGAAELARLAVVAGSRPEGDGRLLRLLARRSDFLTLLAVRVTPGFPHSAINFAAGALALPRGRFLASTALGLAVKSALYATAIHRAARLATLEDAISWTTVAPLAALSVLLLAGPPLVRRLRAGVEIAEP